MSVRECVCVRCEGEWGVLSCVVMKEKTNILHHVPYHTFPHWLGLFKSCCQPCLSASLSLCLGLWELLSTVWRRQTAFPLKFGSPSGELSRPDLQCDMLLCINVLVLLLLQLALSSPVPLTTPSRGCPTCKPKLMQTQASEVLNATAPGVGGQCGVYTLSCALGLRCTPPPGEARPLRALLEGRGVCSNASSIGPTVNAHSAGKGFLLRVRMRKDFRQTCKLKSFELVTVQWFQHPWNNELKNYCCWCVSVINDRCQHHCPYLLLDPALTEDPNEVKRISTCKKPIVSLVTRADLVTSVSSGRVHVGDCWPPLSKVSPPIYLAPNTTSTCPTVTSEGSSERSRQDPHTDPHISSLCSSNQHLH